MKKRTILLTAVLSLSMTVSAFAGAAHAYVIGAEMSSYGSSPAIDTTQEAITVAQNFAWAGYAPQLICSRESDASHALNANTVTPAWLNSGVVYLAGHGTSAGTEVLWTNANTNLNYRVSNYSLQNQIGRNINDTSIPNCKLAIMAACYSGLTGGIANSFQQQGADCAIGWKYSVSDVSMARYNAILTSHLADGLTVQNAIKGANADILNEDDIYVDENVLQYKTYGSGVYNVIKVNNARSMADNAIYFEGINSNDEGVYNPDTFVSALDTYSVVENDEIYYRNADDAEIVSYLKENVDSRFDPALFEVKEVETITGDKSDMILTYRFKVGEVVSDFGYNVNIEDYKVVGYKEVGTPLYGYDVPVTASISDTKEAKLNEFNAMVDDVTDEVRNQSVDVKFSSKDCEFVYFVNTEYETAEGGIYCVRTRI